MTRGEKVREAQRLRAQGLRLREIAERMGVAPTTAAAWLADPDLAKQRARRERYRGVCLHCGGPTDGSNGYDAPTICRECFTWSEEAILDAIRKWAQAHDGMPPRFADWKHAAPGHPAAYGVVRRFGWNEMLVRAGFRPRQDKRPETQTWIEEQLRAGVPTREIAATLGVTPAAIYVRMRTRGTTATAVRNGHTPPPLRGWKAEERALR